MASAAAAAPTTGPQRPPLKLFNIGAVHEAAQAILNAEREAVKRRVAELEKALEGAKSAGKTEEVTALEARIRQGHVAAGISDPANHIAFVKRQVDLKAEPFATMHQRRWEKFVVPKLMEAAADHKVVGDALPEETVPELNLEVNFGMTDWLGAHGNHLPANWGLYSPEVAITTNDDRVRYFSLLLVDMDRPNLLTNSYEHWCHWLMILENNANIKEFLSLSTNIPVQRRLVIPGGNSPFLGPQSPNTPNGTGKSAIAQPPAETPTLPGTVVFPYVPPHPAMQNPVRTRRYLLTVLEQPDAELKIDMEELKRAAQEARERAEKETDRKSWQKEYVGEGEKRLQIGERGALLPMMKFVKDKGLTLRGYGFWRTGWNLFTPEIYTRLGIHEPVFGLLKPGVNTVPRLLKKIDTATELAASLPGPLTSLTSAALKNFNMVKKPARPRPQVPTRASLYVERLRAEDAQKALERATKLAAKPTKDVKIPKSGLLPEVKEELLNKLPRVSLVAAVGLVKTKEGDVAKEFKGEATKEHKMTRYRYKNV
ncbi:hypothetical protein HK104_006562 [Borealophlyctis nickersoniae]|nr:hypothetical protein HK104_006562 [Borealophlyctis nickersoniae]